LQDIDNVNVGAGEQFNPPVAAQINVRAVHIRQNRKLQQFFSTYIIVIIFAKMNNLRNGTNKKLVMTIQRTLRGDKIKTSKTAKKSTNLRPPLINLVDKSILLKSATKNASTNSVSNRRKVQ
jgi:hypothetical protein